MNYRLIAKVGADLSGIYGFRELWRFFPLPDPIPKGYVEVTEMCGRSVCTEDGRLSPKYWGMRRFIPGREDL